MANRKRKRGWIVHTRSEIGTWIRGRIHDTPGEAMADAASRKGVTRTKSWCSR